MKSYCYYNYCCCCCCCCWYYYYHYYYYYYYYYYIVQIFYTLVIKLNQNSYPDEYFCVQGSTCETQTALKPELDCAFALSEWNFTNNWSQEEYIQTFSGKFLLSCTFQYHFYILIFLKKFHSVIILNFRFSFFLGRVHRSWKNSERVSAQSVCCAGICCWKQFEGKNTVVWNVY